MPIFETGIVQVNSAIGTSSVLVWNPENTSSTTFGSMGSVATTAVLKDVIIQNTGTAIVYIGSGSLTAGAVTTALQIPIGGYVLISGYSVTSPTGTTGQIWGNTSATSAGSASTIAGLSSSQNVVV